MPLSKRMKSGLSMLAREMSFSPMSRRKLMPHLDEGLLYHDIMEEASPREMRAMLDKCRATKALRRPGR